MSPYCNKEIIKHHKEAGMTLVVTLLLMLTLTVMASAVLFVVNKHADMTTAITTKPIAIDSSNACIEEAIAWVQTADGRAWLAGKAVTAIDGSTGYGTGAVKDIAGTGGILYGKTLKSHTKKKSGETRTITFQNRLDKASCVSVTLTVIKKIAGESVATTPSGGEIGSLSGYESALPPPEEVILNKYEILIVAEGVFNVATIIGGTADFMEIDKTKDVRGDPSKNWANSSTSNIEVLFSYQE